MRTIPRVRPVGGVLDEVFAWAYLGPDEIQRSNDADEQLRQINDDALARGAVTQEVHDITEQHIIDQNIETTISDPETSIYSGFKLGAAEGLARDINLVGSGTNKLITYAGVALAIYLILKLETT